MRTRSVHSTQIAANDELADLMYELRDLSQ